MSILIDAAYLVGAVAVSPVLAVKALTDEKYRTGFPERFGDVAPRYGDAPCVWLHAVSVGEMNLIGPLVAALEAERRGWELVLSTATNTGREVARKRYPEHRAIYYPLDFSWMVRRALRRLRPDLILLVELELWPNFLAQARELRTPVAIVNGRVSDRSFPRYRLLRPLVARWLDRIELSCVQNETYAERLVALGAEPERVVVTGNLKFDACPAEAAAGRDAELAASFGLGAQEPLLVGGCTWPGEDEALVSIYQELREEVAGLRLLLAPRQADRFDAVARLVEDAGLTCVRRSALKAGAEPSGEGVLLLDTMGELAEVYGLASVVFVGGSLTPHGGHNTLEAASRAKAVVFGPHTENFRDVNQELLACDAARRVGDAAGLRESLRELLTDSAAAAALGRRARAVVDQHRGATRRTLDALERFLPASRDEGA